MPPPLFEATRLALSAALPTASAAAQEVEAEAGLAEADTN